MYSWRSVSMKLPLAEGGVAEVQRPQSTDRLTAWEAIGLT
jgi:hypothetical protein